MLVSANTSPSGVYCASVFLLPLWVAWSVLMAACFVNRVPDLTSKRNELCASHGRVFAFMVALKTLLSGIFVFGEHLNSWAYELVVLIGSVMYVFAYVQWLPYFHQSLNQVQAAFQAPSLYDEVLRLIARRGISMPASHTQRDWTQPYVADTGVEAAWLQVYRAPREHWDLYQLAEELTDLEDAFRLWRFRHVTTVERVIGFKRGTGGTGGVSYLRKMLDVVLFPEIWTLRTGL